MHVVIVSSNQDVCACVTAAAQKTFGTRSALPVLSFDSALQSIADREHRSTLVVLACSAAFTAAELTIVKQICMLQPERVRLVAVGTAAEAARVLEIIRCGAMDYLDVGHDLHPALSNVIARIRTLEQNSDRIGKLFAVVSPVGGSGASFLACNLAAVLAEAEGSAGLIDLHLRGGDQAQLLNLNPRHTLASLSAKANQLDAAMFEQSLCTHDVGIHLLAGPEPFADYRQIPVESVQRILDMARARFPYVVVDLEDVEHAEQLRTLAICDRALILLRPDYVALSRCKRLLDYLARAKVQRENITVVVNRTGEPRALPLECMAEVLGMPLVHSIPNDTAAVSTSYNLGAPLVVSDPATAVARSIRRVAADLLGERVTKAEPECVGWTDRLLAKLQRWNASFGAAPAMSEPKPT